MPEADRSGQVAQAAQASPHGSSFRDPSGRIVRYGDTLYRTVSASYAQHYDYLMSSGLYQSLTADRLLVSHAEVDIPPQCESDPYRVLLPEAIPFISYPWGWSFTQLQDAALLTLEVAWRALEHGMVLKDANAFNVQFIGSRPIFIDTLSFEVYEEGEPWVAYQQFCEFFLAPLELEARIDPSLAQLFRTNLSGVPLGLASKLLPLKTRFMPSTALHIHAHARAQKRYEHAGDAARGVRVSKHNMFALLDSLRTAVKRIPWSPPQTEWGDYYSDTNYSASAMAAKEESVRELLGAVSPATVWDLGANTGRFSEIAADLGAYTIALDIDPVAIDSAYRKLRSRSDERILPLRMDLMNPTPSLGWALGERMALTERPRPDALLALALVHHLAIGQNVPLDWIAQFFSTLSDNLVIEFVPKSDSQVQRLLQSREDIFPQYTQAGFEQAFSQRYSIRRSVPVAGSERTLYLMERLPDQPEAIERG